MHIGFWWEILNATDHLKGLGVGGRIILKIIFKENAWEGVACVNLVPHMDRWRALVKTTMNLRVS